MHAWTKQEIDCDMQFGVLLNAVASIYKLQRQFPGEINLIGN